MQWLAAVIFSPVPTIPIVDTRTFAGRPTLALTLGAVVDCCALGPSAGCPDQSFRSFSRSEELSWAWYKTARSPFFLSHMYTIIATAGLKLKITILAC